MIVGEFRFVFWEDIVLIEWYVLLIVFIKFLSIDRNNGKGFFKIYCRGNRVIIFFKE